jgi:hypothetical protein
VSTLGVAARAYAVAGYEVVPLRGKFPLGNCPECEPRSPSYRPHRAADCAHELCHGLYAATSDPGRVERWWARWPQANIGARIPRSLLVVDVDPRHGGQVRLAELEREHGPLPPTRVSVSGRGDGGRHCWFLHPGGRLSAVRLGAGLDLKTHTGYVLLPPSRHPATGRRYCWVDPDVDPAPLPGWLARLLTPPAATPAPAGRRARRLVVASGSSSGVDHAACGMVGAVVCCWCRSILASRSSRSVGVNFHWKGRAMAL